MGYYDQDFLNYYYYMASQFAVSDRWFSPMASQEHSQPHRDLERRHNAGPGIRSGLRRSRGVAGCAEYLQGAG